MNISQLLEALKDPSSVLTIGEKLFAGFSVAILSMTVVFIILVLIAGIINLLKIEKSKPDNIYNPLVIKSDLNIENINTDIQDMKELVAIITAAICEASGNSENNIIVRKIVRSNNTKSRWESMSKNMIK